MNQITLVSAHSLPSWYAVQVYRTEHVSFFHEEKLKEVEFSDGDVRIHRTPIYTIEINGVVHPTTGSTFNSSRHVAGRIQTIQNYVYNLFTIHRI